MKDDLLRLNKAIAKTGFCSRRSADTLIFNGHIKVNGQLIINPAFQVSQSDIISIDDKKLEFKTTLHYIIINKPIHVVSTMSDPENRKTVNDFVPDTLKPFRLFPVGRLDYFSEGLLIMTNDGILANRLMHPRYHLPKTYEVKIRGIFDEDKINRIKQGFILNDGKKLLPIKVKIISNKSGLILLQMTLFQGINRQIRKICSELNWTILKLIRIKEGPISLGKLPSGQFRILTDKEISELKSQTQITTRNQD